MPQTIFPCSEDVPRALLREYVHVLCGPIRDDLEDPITKRIAISGTVSLSIKGVNGFIELCCPSRLLWESK